MTTETDFTTINKLQVTILSYKTQLSKVSSIEEIEKICKSILDLENEILFERRKELKVLYTKKEEILQKMASFEASLDEINIQINGKISRYRDIITNRISNMETEINQKNLEN